MRFGELFLCRTVALPPLVGKGSKQKGRRRASTGRYSSVLVGTAAASPQRCPVAPSATCLAAGSVTAARQSQPCGRSSLRRRVSRTQPRLHAGGRAGWGRFHLGFSIRCWKPIHWASHSDL